MPKYKRRERNVLMPCRCQTVQYSLSVPSFWPAVNSRYGILLHGHIWPEKWTVSSNKLSFIYVTLACSLFPARIWKTASEHTWEYCNSDIFLTDNPRCIVTGVGRVHSEAHLLWLKTFTYPNPVLLEKKTSCFGKEPIPYLA